MTRNEIASFALKILGIFCIIFAVTSLENLMAYAIYITGDSAGTPIEFAHLLFYAIVPFTILLLSGILLIKYSIKWGTKFWPADDKVTTPTGISYDEVQIIGSTGLNKLWKQIQKTRG